VNLRIDYLTGPTPDFISLVALLDEELREKNGELQKIYDDFNTLNGIDDFFIAYSDNVPAGIAALKRYDELTYEVKRVFVKKEFRCRGIAKRLMQRLEAKAAESKIKFLILETSKDFTVVVYFYRNLGYRVIENYGQYAGMADSVCMRKKIVGG
jgi:GNAT superfamily N-acetyltransferase